MKLDLSGRPANRRGSRHNIDRAEYLSMASKFASKGESRPNARLNADLVREIRDTTYVVTAKEWARRLGVHERTITGAREMRTWAWVD